MTTANINPIEEAKAWAREAIHEAWPTAKEVDQPTESMYEFDAYCIDDETCEASSVSIMHDPDADTFALVINARVDKTLVEEAEHELRVSDLLGQIELKVMMLMQISRSEAEVAAMWSAVSSTTAQSARLRLYDIGGDVDRVRMSIDRFFLENPE